MTSKNLLKTIIITSVLLISTNHLFAQVPVDGFYPKKNSLVVAASYDYKTFDDFYNGSDLIDGPLEPLGEVSSSIASIYAQYAFSDRISATLTLPYISVGASENGVDNVSGLQDLGLFVKGLVKKFDYGSLSGLSLGGAFGVTFPVSDYDGGGILSLGSTATTFNAEAIVLYQTIIRLFVEAKIGSSIKHSSDFTVPPALTYSLKLGYIYKSLYLHAAIDVQDSLFGTEIGSQEFINAGGLGSFPETEVDYTRLSFTVYKPVYKEIIGVSGNFGATLDGKNTPNEFRFGLGVVYKLNY